MSVIWMNTYYVPGTILSASFIHSFNTCLWDNYCVSSTIVGTENTTVGKIGWSYGPCEACILGGKADNKEIKSENIELQGVIRTMTKQLKGIRGIE